MAETGNAGLEDWVEVITDKSLNFQPQNEIQFALFASAIDIRAEEFRHFYEKLAPGATVVFHDTGARHQAMVHAITELIAKGQLTGSFFPTPRGPFVGTVQRSPVFPGLAPCERKPVVELPAPNASSCRRAAILLGVHRSGTSCLVHLLNVLGAKLPEQLVGPSHSNPFGH